MFLNKLGSIATSTGQLTSKLINKKSLIIEDLTSNSTFQIFSKNVQYRQHR